MKERWLALALLAVAGCRGAADRPCVVLTTFQPLYSFASGVARGSRTLVVKNLAPRDLGPHDYDPEAPEHRAAFETEVQRADAIVTLRSLRLAERFDRLYPLARRLNIRIVELDPAAGWDKTAPRLALAPDPAGGPEPNPHVWLSLSHAAILVANLARDLAALDPASADLYRANAEKEARALLALRAEFLARLAEVESVEVAALTEGFPYLTDDLGIRVVAYILGERKPEAVARRVKAAGVRVAIAEREPPAPVRRAVESAGARVVVLSTLEEGWGEGKDLDPEGYAKGMRANLEKLAGALGAGSGGR